MSEPITIQSEVLEFRFHREGEDLTCEFDVALAYRTFGQLEALDDNEFFNKLADLLSQRCGLSPDEEHKDAVRIGEAEIVWDEVVGRYDEHKKKN